MPKGTFVEIPAEEQAQILAALRRARYGYLLALHILLLCAVGRTPTAIAGVLFCSRSSVYRTVRAYRAGTLGWEHDKQGRLLPSVRTRWSCATLARTWQTKRGILVSAETMRRWLHEVGWVWKRAKLIAKDDDPHRAGGGRRNGQRWAARTPGPRGHAQPGRASPGVGRAQHGGDQ